MKIRTDFVTNSSSSSFVCEVCGRTESGWDMSLDEAEMYECVNGHTICEEDILDPSKEELVDYIINFDENYCGDTREEYFNKLKGMYGDFIPMRDEMLKLSYDTLQAMCFANADFRYCTPESMCPICQFIKCSERDIARYLVKKYGITREEVFAQVKTENRRRKKLYNSEYISYVCRQKNINIDETIEEIKKTFGSYRCFLDFIGEITT